MSYNIMSKNASFKGDISGTIENQVNDWDTQTIGGNKTFTNSITSSAGVMLSGSGKVSASFFFGDGSGLSGVATAAGATRQVQFNDGGSALGASANFKFTAANKLEVLGQISASLGVSGSEFHGDGSNLTSVTASFVTASNVNGILNASQVNLGEGLESNANAIRVKLAGVNTGLSRSGTGISLDVDTLTNGSYSDGSTIALGQGASNTVKITLSKLEQNLNISGSNLVGANSIPNSVLPTNITASGHVSASAFFGDGSALDGVTATPTPAGANTQIQFNDGGSLAGDADLTFIKGTNTLATTIVSASAHVSASEFATANGTVIDSSANFAGNNAFFNEITASSEISSSADIFGLNFRGNGSTLNNVPLGSSNAASVVFIDNAGNQTITTNSAFTFNGTNVVNTGGGFQGTTLSSSGDTSIGGNLKIGGQTLSAAELGVLDGVTAGTVSADKAMVVNSDKAITGFKSLISETDNSSRISVTGSAGRLLANIEGITFKNTANATTAKVLQSGVISGSSDLEVGGHITGSGDIKLLNGSIYLANGGSLFFDGDDGGAAIDVSISELGTNKLLLDGNNQVVIRQDEYFVIQDHSSAARLTADLRSTAAINKITTDLAISSSNFISASALHTMTGITAPGPGGDINVLDSNGNLNVGSITMADGAGALNFGNNEISGSGNISGSAFFGDGSNLQNVQATPQFRYQYINSVVKMNTNLVTANSFQLFPADADGLAQSSDRTTHFVMPGSGSIERVIMTPSFYNTNGSSANVFTTAHSPQFFVRKNDITEGTPISGIALQMTASAANMKPLNLPNNAGTLNTQIVIFDLDNNSPAITGSNSFDPGDILIFSGRNDAVVSDVAITIVLKIEEAGVTYP